MALLDRYIGSLDALGISATVVAGYRAETVKRRIDELAPKNTATVVVYPDFHLGSIVSLSHGLAGVDEPILLMDGDVLFHPDLLRRLVAAPHANALLVDVGTEFTGEEYMAGVDSGRVRALRRAPTPGHEATGEWVGFARLDSSAVAALRRAITRQIAAGEISGGYEDSLASILGQVDVQCVDVGGLPWIEIDFPEDAARAETILPRTPH